ncbi:hypothetical protein [uncultured Enterobacter sp.]|uniref:beta family protein n=1 Tax=uncultured Enterobacter sp. TaxID=238202 RepID=UPI0025FEEC86|nr:hypothetical protein [uncultured Enterobacter sp.]
MRINYFPIMKTTIAEMRALKKLSPDVLDKITPIFELTKSRKSKNNQESCVFKKIDEIKSIISERKFILDLTSIDSLSNEQINSFQNDDNAFDNWCEFINSIRKQGVNVTPVLIAYPDSTIIDLDNELNKLCQDENKVAIRIPIYENDLDDLFKILKKIATLRASLIEYIIFDAGYIPSLDVDFGTLAENISYFLEGTSLSETKLIIASSSFPASALDKIQGDKYNNHFDLDSIASYRKMTKLIKNKGFTDDFYYGDYACIHPNRNEGKAYNWIPRIDYPTIDVLFFSRVRREDGGYVECSKNITSLPDFKTENLKCWGIKEIIQTSMNNPGGLSPSYWISVRSNIHMTRMTSIKW